ncbi:MAG: M23 family metallopeptidase [Candidatus Gracilibacteria bacterium]|nr:M23 family metallopeptidase [Candidatus Gracilibacteria bacterium]
MKIINIAKKISHIGILGIFTITSIGFTTNAASNKIVYPLKEISKLECRFQNFGDLKSNCIENLPILKTRDYDKYISKNGGYNDYTRLYTVLWGASYKYGWDVGNGGHIGTDIATAKGTPVYSIADGTVIHAKSAVALGNMVSIEHKINGKKIVSNYAHLSKYKVKKGMKVKVGQKIGEVGSTGNSTGNHLHFQIDLDTPFHPYYYSHNACPYSYYKITEEGICFDELEKNTIDPLLFLETNGSVLNNITTKRRKSSTSSTSKNNYTKQDNKDIFSKTVYIGYSKSDIKEVQKIYKEMGVYKGRIDGKYENILDDIIDYQIDTGVIKHKNDHGAGWFGPKTRAQTKKDYDNHIAKSGKSGGSNSEKVYISSGIKTKKISKKRLLTREEIELREVKEFLKDYKISMKFSEIGGNIQSGKTAKINLVITNKKGKAFKGNMPGGMTFIADTDTVQIFPQKLFYFTDGKREIFVKGLKPGNITISVQVGGTTIKRIPVKVYSDGQIIYPEKVQIIGKKTPVLGEKNTAIGIFYDKSGKKLINLKYGSTYKVNTNNGTQICLKSGTIKTIKSAINKTCNESDYSTSQTFTYEDTIEGILIFDYKAQSRDTKLEIVNTYNNKVLATQKLTVKDPKGLKSNYVYKTDIMNLLQEGVADGINKGYFLEKRDITKKEALNWISNALHDSKDNAVSLETRRKIDNSLIHIKNAKKQTSKYTKITRKDFLDLTYTYLVFDENKTVSVKRYKDLDDTLNNKASYILNNTTWKDKFGENYFQPKNNITRGEAAFMLNNILNQNKQVFLTVR